MTTELTLDPARQEQAKQYARIKRRLWLVSTAFSLVYLLAWILTGWTAGLRDTITAFLSGFNLASPWLVVPLYALVFGGIYALVNLPLDYYSGYILPHRFGQSTQSRQDWIMDQVKGLLVAAPIGLVLLELLYLALRLTGEAWWLWATGGMLVFSVLLANLAPVLIMPLFNKFIPLGDEHADLERRLLQLAERAGTRVKGVFKFDMSRRTKSANAGLTGIGNSRRIVLGDTLIDEFTPDEIETVLAHELGHQVNKDIFLMMAFSSISTALGLYLAAQVMGWFVDVFQYQGVADVAALPALGLVLSFYGLLTMPIENGFSRWRERLADQFALEATGKGQAFTSAFVRLANQNLAEIDPEPWVVFLFYSHPPLQERIRRAKEV